MNRSSNSSSSQAARICIKDSYLGWLLCFPLLRSCGLFYLFFSLSDKHRLTQKPSRDGVYKPQADSSQTPKKNTRQSIIHFEFGKKKKKERKNGIKKRMRGFVLPPRYPSPQAKLLFPFEKQKQDGQA
jgi:hypothetical protein